ncbi:MAG TPA: hypothetical protein VNO33_09905 [Kofleriaceae bacterium]|nr:hypothetical protein [Kofleriaceae bacterium]
MKRAWAMVVVAICICFQQLPTQAQSKAVLEQKCNALFSKLGLGTGKLPFTSDIEYKLVDEVATACSGAWVKNSSNLELLVSSAVAEWVLAFHPEFDVDPADAEDAEENKEEIEHQMFYAANKGHADAEAYYGWMYSGLAGYKQDGKKLLHWCQLSAKQGSERGMSCMANAYEHGIGVPRDLNMAIMWINRQRAALNKSIKNSESRMAQEQAEVPVQAPRKLSDFERFTQETTEKCWRYGTKGVSNLANIKQLSLAKLKVIWLKINGCIDKVKTAKIADCARYVTSSSAFVSWEEAEYDCYDTIEEKGMFKEVEQNILNRLGVRFAKPSKKTKK